MKTGKFLKGRWPQLRHLAVLRSFYTRAKGAIWPQGFHFNGLRPNHFVLIKDF